MHLNQIVLLCRPGFEKECAGEIMFLAAQHQFPGYVQTRAQSGYVRFISTQSTLPLLRELDFRQLIFVRQWFASPDHVLTLPEKDRVSAILDALACLDDVIRESGFHSVELSYPDTNEGKSLSRFCRQFEPHLQRALRYNNLLAHRSTWRLHLLFTDSLHVTVGLADRHNSANVAMGIPRLRMPAHAPSRSTLKLEEAILWFLPADQQAHLLKPAMRAVDLGAAPGGWSWQLIQRNLFVTAIDNGPMQNELLQSGMLEHKQTDAFTYTPHPPVDWLVCDMAERPLHVSRLIARWFSRGLCQHSIFNLKLPMKKRLDTVHECLELIRSQLDKQAIKADIQAKQLYHDREEVTVCILTR